MSAAERRFGRRSAPVEAETQGTFNRLRRAWGGASEKSSSPPAELGTLDPARAGQLIELFEASGKGWFWETDRDGTVVYVSQRISQQLGREHSDLLGSQFTGLLAADEGNEADSSDRSLRFYLSSRAPFSELIVRANSKEEIWWAVSGEPISDECGRFFGFRGIATDLTEHRRSEVELNRLARYDSLTGLANRAMMRRYLEDALWSAAKRRQRCAVFLLDLDRFKAVNDTLGHPVGDTLLRLVALRLKDRIGELGQIGRLGGDEFQAVLPAMADEDELSELAERIVEDLSRPYAIGPNTVSIGTSIGIAVSDYDDRTADDLVRDADLALYAAKAAGKGTHRFFAPEMHVEAQERQLLESDLRKALEQSELAVFYQPSVSLATEQVVGFEALVRWQHPVRGWVPPSIFIPLAEESGLINTIGEFVLRTACADAAKWPSGIKVAVNLSPLQFANANLATLVSSILSGCGLPAHRLELEITEGVLLNDDEKIHKLIGRLKALGVKLALDDFGTGYSSLGYLLKVPFDKIKIDQSFVRGASIEGSKNSAIIRAVVMLAGEFSMETTAEGVETHDELALIKGLGCSLVQGYIYGKPMPAAEAQELVCRNGSVAADGFVRARPERRRILRNGSIHDGFDAQPVRLRNISPGGALIECSGAFEINARLRLDIMAGDPIEAEVRWSKDNQVGLHFLTPFNMKNLAQRDSPSKGADMLKPTYLNARGGGASTEGADKERFTAGSL